METTPAGRGWSRNALGDLPSFKVKNVFRAIVDALRVAKLRITEVRFRVALALARAAAKNEGRDGRAAIDWIKKVGGCSEAYAKIVKTDFIKAGIAWFERDEEWHARAGEKGRKREPPCRFVLLLGMGLQKALAWIERRRRQLRGEELDEQLAEELRSEPQREEGPYGSCRIDGASEAGAEAPPASSPPPSSRPSRPPAAPPKTTCKEAWDLVKSEYPEAFEARYHRRPDHVPESIAKAQFYGLMGAIAGKVDAAIAVGLPANHVVCEVLQAFMEDPGPLVPGDAKGRGKWQIEHHPFPRFLQELFRYLAWYTDAFIVPRLRPPGEPLRELAIGGAP